MSTPRTPPPSMDSSESSKRNLSDSAPVNEDQKRQKAEDLAAPAWAASFFTSLEEKLDSKLSTVQNQLTALGDKIEALEGINSRVGELEEQVGANTEEIETVNESMARLFQENKQLFDQNRQLREGLAKLEATKADTVWVAAIHDEQLRNSMTICGVERLPNEKSWNDCKKALAKALAKLGPE